MKKCPKALFFIFGRILFFFFLYLYDYVKKQIY